MAQGMVGQDQGHHGFTHGHGADTHARIMTALGDDLCFLPAFINGQARRQN
jgi:hypothetical protein